ncbi:unnamed protein product [Durusdinium trenchii]|uniref:Uncharacterized protein n=1 Tax=Durusdinium trenchii TaxID=1381693 RepID=A0ABP0P2W8_9DINO
MPEEEEEYAEEEEEEELEMEKVEVERPRFFHGPRVQLCTDDKEQKACSSLCYNTACDLVFAAQETVVLAYSGEELVTNCKDAASFSKVTTSPKCRIETATPPTLVTTNEEGAAWLCIITGGGGVSLYSVGDLQKGTVKEVCSYALDSEDICMATWKDDDLICVYKSGRVYLIQPKPGGGHSSCIYETSDFMPSCVTALPRSDVVLLGGKPQEEQSNLWAVDSQMATPWAVQLDEVPSSTEDMFYYGCLCCLRVVTRQEWQVGDPFDIVMMYVTDAEDQNDAFNLQAVVSVDPDCASATVKAFTTYEIFMEQYVEQMFLHSLWIPDWSILIMGVTAATDLLLLSSHDSLGSQLGWAPLGLPEGKQLNCPNSVVDSDTTKLRGLCLVTSFKGTIPRKETTEPDMEAPPVVLLAASDGTVSIHYCDHDLPPPQHSPLLGKPGVSKAAMASSPFAATGTSSSPFQATSKAPAMSPFGGGSSSSGGLFGSASAASPFASLGSGEKDAKGTPFQASTLAGTPFGGAAKANYSSRIALCKWVSGVDDVTIPSEGSTIGTHRSWLTLWFKCNTGRRVLCHLVGKLKFSFCKWRNISFSGWSFFEQRRKCSLRSKWRAI